MLTTYSCMAFAMPVERHTAHAYMLGQIHRVMEHYAPYSMQNQESLR